MGSRCSSEPCFFTCQGKVSTNESFPSEHVNRLAGLYFPGWVARCEASLEILDNTDGYRFPDGKFPRPFGIFHNFCINAPRALWNATDAEIGAIPESVPPTGPPGPDHYDERQKMNRQWKERLKTFFDRIVTVVFASQLTSQLDNMVKALPHVDAKNPAAGICVLFILGEQSPLAIPCSIFLLFILLP